MQDETELQKRECDQRQAPERLYGSIDAAKVRIEPRDELEKALEGRENWRDLKIVCCIKVKIVPNRNNLPGRRERSSAPGPSFEPRAKNTIVTLAKRTNLENFFGRRVVPSVQTVPRYWYLSAMGPCGFGTWSTTIFRMQCKSSIGIMRRTLERSCNRTFQTPEERQACSSQSLKTYGKAEWNRSLPLVRNSRYLQTWPEKPPSISAITVSACAMPISVPKDSSSEVALSKAVVSRSSLGVLRFPVLNGLWMAPFLRPRRVLLG